MKTLIIATLFLFTIPLWAADSYLCITEYATGFKFNSDTMQWRVARLKVGQKYIIKKSNQKKYKWEVSEHGKKYLNNVPLSYCSNNFNENGFLTCEYLFNFTMNKTSLRFKIYEPVGYVLHKDIIGKALEGMNEPSMQIGKCSKI